MTYLVTYQPTGSISLNDSEHRSAYIEAAGAVAMTAEFHRRFPGCSIVVVRVVAHR